MMENKQDNNPDGVELQGRIMSLRYDFEREHKIPTSIIMHPETSYKIRDAMSLYHHDIPDDIKFIEGMKVYRTFDIEINKFEIF